MAEKLGRVVKFNEELPLIKLDHHLITCFLRSRDKLNIYISIYTLWMATNHGKVVTYYEGLPPINSHNPLNMWSLEREHTWQLKTYLRYRNIYGH